MMLTWILTIINLAFLLLAALFTLESRREQEPRAWRWGAAAVGLHIFLAWLIIALPDIRGPVAAAFGIVLFTALALLLPLGGGRSAPSASQDFIQGAVKRFDERDIVFARNRSLPPGSEHYQAYYRMHPELEQPDARRRELGGPLGRMGAIDGGYAPNVAMMQATFALPAFLGPHAVPQPAGEKPAVDLPPAKASRIVKGFASHLGADLVGICRVNPLWSYARRGEIHYGNWEDWGTEIPEPLPFAVVIATEMDHAHVGSGPHTPAVIESGYNYAKGAFITTQLALWFAALGYRAGAQHSRHYDLLLVPLAVDAGLGEYGRLGYLVADRFGPRVRLFAVTTNMPLLPDQPVDLGVQEFCRRCLKCAAACPSRSIPTGEPSVVNGTRRWKLNPETCFDYWGKVGTDCSVCMGICPFSRPHRSVHRLVRWTLRRSTLARRLLPKLDNLIYGKTWKSRRAPDWLSPPKKSRQG